MKPLYILGAAALALPAASAFAAKVPQPCGHDARIRCADYDPGQIWEIWTAPGAILEIQFSPEENVPEGNVAATDGSRLDRKPRGNFLYLKLKGCLDPEPLLVTTKLPSGELRSYKFQIESRGSDCSEPAVMTQPSVSMASTADGAPRQPHHGNLKYVAEDGLAAGADVMYAVQFTYSRDEAAKRRAAARVRQAEQQREQAQLLLKQQTSWPYGNQWDGTWNFKYVAHGNLSVTPRQIRDNGYETVFLFPQMQRVPALFRLQPGATRCNREHDDHNEATENPSVHRSGADGDTIIAQGTAQGWCLRDGNTVLEVLNFAYSPTGATPATGTVSPYVTRTLKGESNPDDSGSAIPRQPQPQANGGHADGR
jgi:type IV secretion system protein VirB9